MPVMPASRRPQALVNSFPWLCRGSTSRKNLLNHWSQDRTGIVNDGPRRASEARNVFRLIDQHALFPKKVEGGIFVLGQEVAAFFSSRLAGFIDGVPNILRLFVEARLVHHRKRE